MTRISSQILDPQSGDPVPGVRVYAELVAPATWLRDQDADVTGTVETVTDDLGQYFLDLIPQSYYELPHTSYLIREWRIASYYVQVPVSDSIVHVRDILVNPPESADNPSYWPISTFDTLRDVNPAGRVPGDYVTVGQDGRLSFAAGSGSAPQWFAGDGAPPDVIVGARPHDIYYDRLSGDLYTLE